MKNNLPDKNLPNKNLLGQILLDHGSGGKISHNLITQMIVPAFSNPILQQLDDGAVFPVDNGKLAFSTDTFVVDPIFFPGGNIGDLAVNGTVNDISMCGAKPLYLSCGFILEEGFDIKDLNEIINTMKIAAQKAKISIVTGDTKVVPKGAVDKIFINTSGVGICYENVNVSSKNAKPGDKIIINGTIADHGIAILSKRENLSFESQVKSDTAALNHLIEKILNEVQNIHVFRDPTRGGVATTLKEIAIKSNLGINLFEDKLPIKSDVMGLCELLGFDPLYIANEGKVLVFVSEKDAQKVLEIMQKDDLGKNASIIGEVVSDNCGKVIMKTLIGGSRIIDMLTGEQLPRIC